MGEATGAGSDLARPIRVLLVDDDPLVCSGLSLMLSAAPDLAVVGAVHDGDEVIGAIHRHRPDVVLMDLRMRRQGGIKTTESLTGMPSRPKVLVLTTYDLDEVLLRALRAGADGFLLKTASPTEIMAGIRSVHAGQGVLSPMSAGQAIRSVHGDPGVEARRAATATSMAGLTGRERAVCVLVARGMTNSAVGARLFMSEATVKTHLASAQARLGVGNRVEVAVLIERVGLLDE